MTQLLDTDPKSDLLVNETTTLIQTGTALNHQDLRLPKPLLKPKNRPKPSDTVRSLLPRNILQKPGEKYKASN
ncbi:MAG: hypothetical protein ABI045_05350 [Flavobacteriales bacterium]